MAGYIGSKASVVSSGAERKKTFAITTTTTALTGLVYTPTKVHVFHNGVRLVDGTDFTATNSTSITLTVAAESGDQVVVVSYASFQVADAYTQTEADAEFVAKSGDTMTGPLSVTGTVTATADFKGHSSSSGDYVRMYGGTGTGKWDIYGNGENLRISDNESAGAVQFDTNVGIGTTPSADWRTAFNTTALQVGQSGSLFNLDVSNSDRRCMLSSNALLNSSGDFKHIKEGPATVYSQQGGTHRWSTAASAGSGATASLTERMQIDASGNVLVGTTSQQTTSKLSVKTSVDGNGIGIDAHKSQNSNYYFMNFRVNTNTAVGNIYSNGSSTIYATSSDYRLKENTVSLTGASERVNQLLPKRFSFINDETSTLVDGFLAHEIQSVVPEAILGTKDAMMDEDYEVTAAIEATYDDDGNELTAAVDAVMGTRSVPDYQGIDQSKLVPLLTAALQEALTKIDNMETRLAALEGN